MGARRKQNAASRRKLARKAKEQRRFAAGAYYGRQAFFHAERVRDEHKTAFHTAKNAVDDMPKYNTGMI